MDQPLSSWMEALQPQFDQPYYQNLMQRVENERNSYPVYPPNDQVFSWMNYCCIENVKAVILGQDPYPAEGKAHGLAFSVAESFSGPRPTSISNIFAAAEKSYPDFVYPNHSDLSGWARQGVLLLNRTLTVRDSLANSHKNFGWKTFTDRVISWINCNLSGVVFLLWGREAWKVDRLINPVRHHVLKTYHPASWGNCHSTFINCNHFFLANQYLIQQGKTPIDWCTL